VNLFGIKISSIDISNFYISSSHYVCFDVSISMSVVKWKSKKNVVQTLSFRVIISTRPKSVEGVYMYFYIWVISKSVKRVGVCDKALFGQASQFKFMCELLKAEKNESKFWNFQDFFCTKHSFMYTIFRMILS